MTPADLLATAKTIHFDESNSFARVIVADVGPFRQVEAARLYVFDLATEIKISVRIYPATMAVHNISAAINQARAYIQELQS